MCQNKVNAKVRRKGTGRVLLAMVLGAGAVGAMPMAARALEPATEAATRPADEADAQPLILKGVDRDGRIALNTNKSRMVSTRLPCRVVDNTQPDIVLA